jgi:tripartite ATP-independent transporter DctM subunit
VATIGKVAIPEMKRHQYDESLAIGSVAASGTLGVLIPPSVIGVIYAITVECSVGQILMAGFIHGILSALLYMLMVVIRVKLKPELAPSSVVEVNWRTRLLSFKGVAPTLMLFSIVIGGIYSGMTTATEAAALGAFAAFLMLMVRTRGNKREIIDSLQDAVCTTAVIFAIIIGASIFSLFVTMSGLPAHLAEWLVSLHASRMIILFFILLIYIPLGMFLDSISMLLVTLPVFYPIIEAMDFSAIWFGILVIKTIEIGLITPPVGVNVYILKGLAPEIETTNIFRYVLWFLVVDVITLVLLIAIPSITLFLPQQMQ